MPTLVMTLRPLKEFLNADFTQYPGAFRLLVGKIDEGRACAVVFDCKFIETSASLHHNVHELFEGIVRQIRLRRDSKEINERRRSIYKRKESITKKARRFLDRLVAKNNKKMALKVRSKSCHDLAVL